MLVDLRSDTVTKPSPAMRQAMADALVGDDVFGEDPTVNKLQEMAADLLGHEASLFVPSGTMANSLAIKILTRPGDEIIMESGSHPINYESGAPAVISSVQCRLLNGNRGLLEVNQIKSVIRPKDIHIAPARLISLENTHNQGGGTVYPLETIAAIGDLAKSRGLYMHLDGARLFNATVASGVDIKQYARHFDTVSFCLSKGLGAPIGSLLCTGRELIAEALRWRKLLGGGMRQVGIIAAAGIYALENNVQRLSQDHQNAKMLAQGLNECAGLEIDTDTVQTNIVIFKMSENYGSAESFVGAMQAEGVLMLALGSDMIRAVTHLDVDRQGIEYVIEMVNKWKKNAETGI